MPHFGLVIYGSLETISGGYLYDRKLVEYLQQQGDQVEFLALPWRNYPRHLMDNLSAALYKRLRSKEVDLWLQDELNHPSLFGLNRRFRQEVDVPLVTIVHHLRCSEARQAWLNAFYRLVEGLYLKSVDGFVFNSHTTRRVVQSLVGTRQPNLVAYPAGDRFQAVISPSQIEARAHAAGSLRLLFVGNVIPRKGLHVLLESIKLLPEMTCSLDIVGSLDVDPAYVNKIRQPSVEARAKIWGSIADEQLYKLFVTSQLLVVPASYEGFGIAYLEGMAFGLPCIGTRAGAAGEVIQDGENGYLIDPGDVNALAERLNQLANERERLCKMSLAARQRFLAHPTWDDTTAAIRTFLLQMLA